MEGDPLAAPNPPSRTTTQPGKAIAFALAAVLLWSTVATGFKLGLMHLSVPQLLFSGTLCSWLVFACACLFRGRTAPPRHEWPLCIALACINPLLYYLILFAAYDQLPAHIAQPLNYTWAITLSLLAVPILKQRLSRQALLGILVSYSGVVVLLLTSSASDTTQWHVSGVALALLSTVLWAIYWLLSTRSLSDPLGMMFYSFSLAIPPLALWCHWHGGWPELNSTTMLYGAWVGCVEMGVTFLLWQRALRLTDRASQVSQLIFLSPFISLIIIHYVLGESIGMGAVAGLTIIVAGLLVGNRSGPPATQARSTG